MGRALGRKATLSDFRKRQVNVRPQCVATTKPATRPVLGRVSAGLFPAFPQTPVHPKGSIMRKGAWRHDPRSSGKFEEWLNANAVVSSILMAVILAMALAGVYSAGRPNEATEFSSVTAPK
jgi:hypothetical protein